MFYLKSFFFFHQKTGVRILTCNTLSDNAFESRYFWVSCRRQFRTAVPYNNISAGQSTSQKSYDNDESVTLTHEQRGKA